MREAEKNRIVDEWKAANRITEGEAEALEVWIGLVGAEPVARALGIADTALDQVRHCGPVTARLAERVRAGLVPRG